MPELVTYELDGTVAKIGLNRTDKRNAINDELVWALHEAVVRAGEEADCGVLFGHGVNFSAGLDLAELLSKLDPNTPKPRKKQRHAWHTILDVIARGPIPFVAACHGAVVGGGLELAAAAHIRVADRTAFFGLPEGQRGIFVGGGGTVRIQRIIGYPVMADMMLTGRLRSVDEAERCNIVRYITDEASISRRRSSSPSASRRTRPRPTGRSPTCCRASTISPMTTACSWNISTPPWRVRRNRRSACATSSTARRPR